MRIVEWENSSASDRAAANVLITRTRVACIETKLLILGWTRIDLDHCLRYNYQYSQLVKVPKSLTDRSKFLILFPKLLFRL